MVPSEGRKKPSLALKTIILQQMGIINFYLMLSLKCELHTLIHSLPFETELQYFALNALEGKVYI
jgi:hypothetical protein